MQLVNSEEVSSEAREFPVRPQGEKSLSSSFIEDDDYGINDNVSLDISGKSLDFPVLENAKDSVEDLYIYKNVYSLIPKSLGALRRLRTLKFFGDEIILFAPEFGNLTGLESLQVKISLLGIGGLPLHKWKDLKKLELCKVPPRLSAFPILSELAGLKCLTKLAICHFSIKIPSTRNWLLKESGGS
ncbi:hypothetical protein L6164_025730 [Bauhinia variegata]|uniref:Uncharacterized protein n=1 Tax=Bauhinia variegata TaxID=167791 RepID=A0ACB9M1T2_BAUVA|nr:hypothetical protein L6164_025730 [Bauhinia variegata]